MLNKTKAHYVTHCWFLSWEPPLCLPSYLRDTTHWFTETHRGDSMLVVIDIEALYSSIHKSRESGWWNPFWWSKIIQPGISTTSFLDCCTLFWQEIILCSEKTTLSTYPWCSNGNLMCTILYESRAIHAPTWERPLIDYWFALEPPYSMTLPNRNTVEIITKFSVYHRQFLNILSNIAYRSPYLWQICQGNPWAGFQQSHFL